MQPYVVKQGDHLAKIAHRLGFDAQSVWSDPQNAKLRNLRANPNILFPGDVLFVPDPPETQPMGRQLSLGSESTFTASPPTVAVSVQFAGDDPSTYASQPFQVAELPTLQGAQTDSKGVATIDVPVTLDHVTLTFRSTGAVFLLQIGAMDPIGTIHGVLKRLQNLGRIPKSAVFDDTTLPLIRSALRHMKAVALPPSSDNGPSSEPDDADSSGDDERCDTSDDPGPEDNAGIDDNGNLDADTAALLIHLHGS